MLKLSICGYDSRKNDVVYMPPLHQNEDEMDELNSAKIVVYFGGDIQDFCENMLTHRDNKNYIEWSLEKTAEILNAKFSNCHILVIRPLRMELKTFSCFDNFVPCGNCGIPQHQPMHNSLKHLQLILENIPKLLESNSVANFSELILIGFSKGCVVLNQFLYEIHEVTTSNTKLDFLTKIKKIYWLDGGHSGGKNTWVTSKPILTSLTKTEIQIFVHVSPYQIDDERRPWIKKEEKLFHQTLLSLKAHIYHKIHFADSHASIQNHFAILNEF